MSKINTIFQGVIHGKTIELDHEAGLPDGQLVTVTIQTTGSGRSLPPGEGLRRSAGAWAEDAAELDAYLERNRGHRKQVRRELEA